MAMRFGLKSETIQKICAVLAQHPQVEQAILYGSRAKGNYKNGSDIDLTLVGDAELTTRVLYQIIDELDELLLPYTIDLAILHDIHDADVLAHIDRVGVVLYDQARMAIA